MLGCCFGLPFAENVEAVEPRLKHSGEGVSVDGCEAAGVFHVPTVTCRRGSKKNSGLSGTLFHHAKAEQRQVVVSWLDLRNAYGSVRHNLIQFALQWFRVPRVVRGLIFD